MTVLTKMSIYSPESIKYAIYQLQNYIIKNNFKGDIIIDAFINIKTNKCKFICQYFNSHFVFISYDSFQQNHKILSQQIRKYVSNLIKCNSLICIGGESYLYALTNNVKNIYHITNSLSIFYDCEFNKQFYNVKISNNLVNYNLCYINSNIKNAIINLSSLNTNLLNIINDLNLNKIIIINCHHDDFWNKIKILSKFKIISRKKFICYYLKYFITVTILKHL